MKSIEAGNPLYLEVGDNRNKQTQNKNDMETPTFEEQYKKIVGAYMRDELEPFNSCACFVGNLLNNKGAWIDCRVGVYARREAFGVREQQSAFTCIKTESNDLYTPAEIVSIEHNFLKVIEETETENGDVSESGLYQAMESTLLMLRQLHESKGEIVKDYSFTKRELVNI